MAVREAVFFWAKCGFDAAGAGVGERWGGGILLGERNERAGR